MKHAFTTFAAAAVLFLAACADPTGGGGSGGGSTGSGGGSSAGVPVPAPTGGDQNFGVGGTIALPNNLTMRQILATSTGKFEVLIMNLVSPPMTPTPNWMPTYTDVHVSRYTATGQLDTGWGSSGSVALANTSLLSSASLRSTTTGLRTLTLASGDSDGAWTAYAYPQTMEMDSSDVHYVVCYGRISSASPATIRLADGSVYLDGGHPVQLTQYATENVTFVIKILADGTVDTSFGTNGRVEIGRWKQWPSPTMNVSSAGGGPSDVDVAQFDTSTQKWSFTDAAGHKWTSSQTYTQTTNSGITYTPSAYNELYNSSVALNSTYSSGIVAVPSGGFLTGGNWTGSWSGSSGTYSTTVQRYDASGAASGSALAVSLPLASSDEWLYPAGFLRNDTAGFLGMVLLKTNMNSNSSSVAEVEVVKFSLGGSGLTLATYGTSGVASVPISVTSSERLTNSVYAGGKSRIAEVADDGQVFGFAPVTDRTNTTSFRGALPFHISAAGSNDTGYTSSRVHSSLSTFTPSGTYLVNGKLVLVGTGTQMVLQALDKATAAPDTLVQPYSSLPSTTRSYAGTGIVVGNDIILGVNTRSGTTPQNMTSNSAFAKFNF